MTAHPLDVAAAAVLDAVREDRLTPAIQRAYRLACAQHAQDVAGSIPADGYGGRDAIPARRMGTGAQPQQHASQPDPVTSSSDARHVWERDEPSGGVRCPGCGITAMRSVDDLRDCPGSPFRSRAVRHPVGPTRPPWDPPTGEMQASVRAAIDSEEE